MSLSAVARPVVVAKTEGGASSSKTPNIAAVVVADAVELKSAAVVLL